ncbi:RHS repeat-associated core domain-containing protein [Dysgonomonas sp. HGC4]|uniref:RHS repeat-associated core domain-containing protein n=1 Tax=Dysgonomonas sp. HGC4 TaxID=1658009 RepID=UPI000682757B|nr:RHS repeat-associated core domain-containing protein [Dysgonomonas sp. HGC4]MBD8348453.1 VCBS repeat-containing protein [Dysgonomonas sp. HGC4]
MKKIIIYIIGYLFIANIHAQTTPLPIWQTNILSWDTEGYPNSYHLDKQRPVGSIPFQQEVSPNGALNYAIPIETYPGRNGLQPNINLSYNSLSGNGISGMGWNIGGLSAITRTNSTLYYNEKVKAAALTEDTPFILDGTHLIYNGTTSHLISERGHIVVHKYSGYFTALFPNGSKAIYGFSENTQEKINYPITRMEDAFGNYIEYSYVEDNNVYYISEIKYGASENSEHFANIKFRYSNRDDITPYYFDGLQVQQTKLLKEITTYFNGNSLQSYVLHHESKAENFLRQIDLVAGGQALNPLVFSYGQNKQIEILTKEQQLKGYIKQPSDNFARGKANLISAKFSVSTGRSGLIVYPMKSNYNISSETGWMYSSYLESDTAYIYSDLNNANLSALKISLKGEFWSEGVGGKFREVLTADVKGDGIEKVIKISESSPKTKNDVTQQLLLNIYDVDSTRLSEYKRYIINAKVPLFSIKNTYATNFINKKYLTGDFNGDGRIELLLFTFNKDAVGGNHKSNTTLIDLNLGEIEYEAETFDIDPEDYVATIDYDGDGKNDILHINKKGLYVYSFDANNGFTQQIFDASINSDLYDYVGDRAGIKDKFQTFALGDINGDGKTDIIISPRRGEECRRPPCAEWSKTWTILYSKGAGLQFGKTEMELKSFSSSSNYFLQDMNGDGLPDLIDDFAGKVTVYFNQNGTFDMESSGVYYLEGAPQLTFTDVLYNNQTTILTGVKNDKVSLISTSINNRIANSLTSSIDGTGIISKYSYSTLLDKDVHTITNSVVAFPYNKIVASMNVVKEVSGYKGAERIASSSYSYKDATIHRQGLGFVGFGGIQVINNLNNVTTSQTFDPYNFGVLKQEDSPLSNTEYDYDIRIAENKSQTINLTKKVTVDKIKGFTVTANYTDYDDYGNVGKESIDYGNGTITEKSLKYKNEAGDVFSYFLGLPLEEIMTSTRNGKSVTLKNVLSYKYKNLPESRTSYYNNNQVSQETYGYNNKWERITVSVKSYSSEILLTKSYEYDSSGRITKETDPMGFTTTTNYKPTTGLVENVKNYKGHTITYEYDTFGRKSKTVYADGSIESGTLTWVDSPTGALYVRTMTTTGKPDTQIYYDVLGREIRKGQKRFDGNYLYTDYVYNEKGLLEKTSMPFKGNVPSLWNTFTYDKYNRITSQLYASGKKDSYAYNKNKVKSIVDGIATIKTTDATGKVIQISDPGGIITYTYRPDGQPDSIKAPGGIITSFGYDDYGRQTTINDPSAGIRTFVYNNAGNIYKETDGNGKSVQMTYDNYNRLKTKEIVGESSASYNYNLDGLLDKETYSHGLVRTFGYDNLLRNDVIKESFTDENRPKWLQKTYSFANGNIASTKYDSHSGNITTEVYTYSNGYHTETKIAGNLTVWKLANENDMGLPTQSQTGNIQRTYGYDAFGQPTTRSAKQGDNIIQDFAYNFNVQTGNLNWRKDNSRNKKEVFKYDNLNRLTQFNGNILTYNAKGNITENNEIGKFGYSSLKPYAMECVNPYGEHIPLREQSITYNAQMRPVTIIENDFETSFTYDVSGNRLKMQTKKDNHITLSRYYLGGQYEIDEKQNSVEERLYLDGDAYGAAAVYIKQNGVWKLCYILRDYLGSITHLTNDQGAVLQELSYDPWGRLRNPVTQELYAYNEQPELVLGRGYTGHEHLSEYGLINMNARLYDPVLGRFLSPDPYVQAPWLTQSFNRYSYAFNNPLRYTDPNGEFSFLAGALIGGFLNLGFQAMMGNIDGVGSAFAAFGIGALAGATGMATGGLISGTGFIAGAASGGLSGVTSGAILGAGNAWASGASFNEGLSSGLRGGLLGAGTGTIIGGVAGGINSVRNGGNFLTGKGYTRIFELPVGNDNTDLGGDAALNQSNLEEIKKELGWKPGKFSLESIDIDGSVDITTGKYLYYRRFDGILEKSPLMGGVTTELKGFVNPSPKNLFQMKSDMYLSFHKTIYGLKLTVNHELIHVYHLALGLRTDMYSEYSATSNTAMYIPEYNLNLKEMIEYKSAFIRGYKWPNYLLKIK